MVFTSGNYVKFKSAQQLIDEGVILNVEQLRGYNLNLFGSDAIFRVYRVSGNQAYLHGETYYSDRRNQYFGRNEELFAENGTYPTAFLTRVRLTNEERLQTWILESDDKLIITADAELLSQAQHDVGGNILSLAATVATFKGFCHSDSSLYIQCHTVQGNYTIPRYIIEERWYEGWTPPKIKRYVHCERCHNVFTIDPDEEALAHEDENLCPECRKRQFVTPYHRYAPQLTFWKTDTEPETNLYYGFELEVDGGGERHENAAKVVKMMNPDYPKFFMYVSHDGSLHEGMELISCPATIKYHQQMESKYKQLFQMLKSLRYRSHDTTTCGLHVHFSRAYFADGGGGFSEEENICKFLVLFEKFWKEIVLFARRDYDSLNHYTKKVDFNDLEEFCECFNKTENHDGHYYAINITNPNTIEIRIYKGTLNISTFMATLLFTDSIVRFTKTHTMGEINEATFFDLLPERAKPYYEARFGLSRFEE